MIVQLIIGIVVFIVYSCWLIDLGYRHGWEKGYTKFIKEFEKAVSNDFN